MTERDDDPEWGPFLEATFVSLLEAADEGLVIFDRLGRCRMMGRRIGEMFGIAPSEWVGRSRDEVMQALSRATVDPESFLRNVGEDDLLEPARVVPHVEIRTPRERTVLWTSFPVAREGGAWGRLGLVRDVSREKNAERGMRSLRERLEQVAPMDLVTRLPNQRRFREELEREHGRSTRAWDSYAILRVDIDSMAERNERLGRSIGDSLLAGVADCLDKLRREYDLVARLSDDEFAVLLPSSDVVAAERVADRLLDAISELTFPMAEDERVTACIGGAIWVPPSTETPAAILRRAGDALRDARTCGPNSAQLEAGTASPTVRMKTPPPPARD
ncbi:MAG: sensor domain-containing diguanylate cyclase [Polyangiaceae bacterium]